MYAKSFDKHLKLPHINRGELLSWAKERISAINAIRNDRAKAATDTLSVGKINFLPLTGGRFEIYYNLYREVGNYLNSKRRSINKSDYPKRRNVVTLTYPFEITETPITQLQWITIIGGDEFAEKSFSIPVSDHCSLPMKIGGRSVTIYPDYPIAVSLISALKLANRLSLQRGLRPVYENLPVYDSNFSDYDSTNITINAPNGNYYLAEGYRLPTEAEREYMTNKAREQYFQNLDQNYDPKKTMPVYSYPPMIIDDQIFYSVFDNIAEWTWDNYYKLHGNKPILSGINPLFPPLDSALARSNFSRFRCPIFSKSDNVPISNLNGFRLVRSIKK
jgi:formylglycine-generating enzyme required for sulfatase activity